MEGRESEGAAPSWALRGPLDQMLPLSGAWKLSGEDEGECLPVLTPPDLEC